MVEDTDRQGGRSEWSVCQFFIDGSHEYVRRFVSLGEAIEAFKHYTTCVAARVGLTERVIMTDGGDRTAVEWIEGKGVTWPRPEEGSDAKNS